MLLTKILIGLIAALHLYIMWFEMFAWETRGPKVFGNFPKELFKPTKALAANQGLYNGFLAAGLIWTFFISDPVWKDNIALFFLGDSRQENPFCTDCASYGCGIISTFFIKF